MEIKLAKNTDINMIIELVSKRIDWLKNRSINQWQQGYLDWFNNDYCNELIAENELYVVLINNKIVGTFALLKNDEEVWDNCDGKSSYYIHHLATDENYKGIGENIINYIIELSTKDGKKYLRLDCAKSNLALNNYYHKFGFQDVGFVKRWNEYFTLRELNLQDII